VSQTANLSKISEIKVFISHIDARWSWSWKHEICIIHTVSHNPYYMLWNSSRVSLRNLSVGFRLMFNRCQWC